MRRCGDGEAMMLIVVVMGQRCAGGGGGDGGAGVPDPTPASALYYQVQTCFKVAFLIPGPASLAQLACTRRRSTHCLEAGGPKPSPLSPTHPSSPH
ncbi:hypothetical protein E2C01_055327 [Portunus trituberculatus]|uniref:Uncharacterized protein n=1 Tax=Portunus trituberculatus TaxID=210409 RepID=A0A5B7GUJ1_PORTR|nr:hypothetical protein [Portunus trituberculatus]